jgi:hypothetical protein
MLGYVEYICQDFYVEWVFKASQGNLDFDTLYKV